ncbi:hypothetical protein BRYFOR_09067 [Marvinbryantia formatexigens DSM 14469]|uniref:Uncharacterized protein n=1 Tax=Marvinbryantia formatexigens DSM 14469 TaxID=478749 RepID=C6LK80_9FIRM|nr:SIR2 family protein [Marvinbryantia formatexigens]EET58961.1 hypothetical protein BRYFOR_09067 [Marvinbryantia formatexigens DSM 14469]UWO23429.1 SIR2 family protein [Marvinbryantia formatexigens DSM 14469]SDH25662.1 SIR2-like domain-containing protein [Marvinbryantia formatexigens]
MNDMTVYSYINDIAQRLKNPRKYGDVSLMIGAGFSKNARSKGMASIQPPNWSELAEKMYEELYPEPLEVQEKEEWNKQRIIKTSGKNVTKLADEYIANFDRNKINNLIEQSIADEMFVPGELHKRLLKLHWSDIFTTNYDTLLEQTVDMIYRENNYEIIYSQNDLPGSIKPRIIKLHGSIPHVKPYIISDENYRTYPDQYSALVNTVQQAMLETRLCLLGFSGDDPNFQSWLGWLRDNMGEYCPTIYLIGLYEKLSAPEKKLLENKGITIVDISELVSQQEENRHYQAISEFVGLLEQNQSEKDIYLERPYRNVDMFWQPKDMEKEEYLKKLNDYSCKVEKLIEPYILLPDEKRVQYADYFSEHFSVMLKLLHNQEKVPEKIISTIIKILRKCLVILEDKNAEYLEKMVEMLIEKNLQIETICEILLYLAEMYRIDGKKSYIKLAWKDVRRIVIKIHITKMNFLLKKRNII